MVGYFIRLRFKIFFRNFMELGDLRVFIVILASPIIISGVYLNSLEFSGAVLFSAIFLMFLLSIHQNRGDKHFLRTLFINPFSIYICEYLVYFIPFAALPALAGQYLLIGCTAIIIPLIALLKPQPVRFNFGKKLRLFPFTLFEWNSGFREYLIYLIAICGLTIILYRFEFGIIIGLLLLGILCSSFYFQCEPRKFIEIFELSPGRFLRRKISLALMAFLASALPFSVIFLVFYWELGIFLIITLLLCSAIITNAIMVKYTFYEEGEVLSFYSGILVTLNIFFVISVFTIHIYLLPVPLILNLWLLKRAKVNLNYILYAYNK